MAKHRTLRHAKSKRTIHVPPAALRSHTYQSPSLVDLCEDAGLDANEAERWFVEQDVPDVDAASELTLGELQEVIGKRATVGKVRQTCMVGQKQISTLRLLADKAPEGGG